MNRSPNNELVVEEYKACRELIKTNIDIIQQTEIYCIGAAAASAVYCLGASAPAVVNLTAGIPLIVTSVGFIRYMALHSTIRLLDDYLREMEDSNPPLYWANFYRNRRRYRYLNIARIAMWIVLVVISTGFSVGVWKHGSFAEKAAISGSDSKKG